MINKIKFWREDRLSKKIHQEAMRSFGRLLVEVVNQSIREGGSTITVNEMGLRVEISATALFGLHPTNQKTMTKSKHKHVYDFKSGFCGCGKQYKVPKINKPKNHDKKQR